MKRYLLNLISLLCVISCSLQAQTTYTIGSDDGFNGQFTYPTPFGDYNKTQRMQFLYLASELSDAGMTSGFIDAVGWTVASLPTGIDATEGYSLKLMTTGILSLGLTTWEEGAETVWGPADYTPVAGVNTFTLNTPFFWDGVSNILIEICGGDDAGMPTKNARCIWSGPLGFNASHTRVNDLETDPCGYTGADYYDAATGGPDYRPQLIFTTTPGANCADLPAIGAASSTASSVCVDENFTLNISTITETGVVYAWYRSPDGIDYTLIPGAVTPAYNTTQTASTYYRCLVTCTFSGDTAHSTPVLVTQNVPTECYCAPTYTTGTTAGDYITNVVCGAITNTTGPASAPFYTYYSELSTNLIGGTSSSISVTVGTRLTNNNCGAWIDFDQNGNFESTEKIGEVINLDAGSTGTITFTIPIMAVSGTTRMRVCEVWNQIDVLPCDTYDFGETEDYNVNIIPGAVPTAAFTHTGEPSVTFTNLTTGLATSYSWNFGDGETSTLMDPTHLYLENGTYNVCLTATNLYGSNTNCQSVVIDTYLAPVADFSYIGEPTVAFTDLSANTPTSWSWNFNDGETSTLANPTHTFTYNGDFNVCLTVANIEGADTHCAMVTIDYYLAPAAEFTYSGDPTVSFVDESLNFPVTWSWNFGDGGTSTLENPTYTYTNNGIYNVCLTATNIAGADTHCELVTIDAYLAPEVYFSFSGDPIVNFVDASLNSPTSWSWTFGDGGTSTLENPTHTYLADGIYNVCLTASNATGSNTACQDVEITSYVYAPVADFTYSGNPDVSFTNLSANDPTYWFWDFGDGASSTLANPAHLFATNGTYTVCLTAGNITGEDEECKNVIITGYTAPAALFSYSGDPVVSFSDLSAGEPTSWFWNFGDGSVSLLTDPTHVYSTNGAYNVCLSVSNPGGTDTYCANVTITGNGSAPETDFTYSLNYPTVLFTDISTNDPSDWLWDFGDGSISGLQNPNHTYAVSGNYEVCLTGTNDFGSMESCKNVAVFPQSITETELAKINISPNPTSQFSVITGIPTGVQIDDLRLVDVTGHICTLTYIHTIGGSLLLDVGHAAPGAYMVIIRTGDITYGGRLIKL